MKFSEFYLADTSDFRFFIRQWQPDVAPKGLIMLIHGHSDHGSRFSFVAEAFARQGYTFFAPDLRGNGKSDGKRGHFPSLGQVLEDIRFLLRECRKFQPDIPVFLYSQSMGGNLAINFALRFPDEIQGLVASSPWLRLTKPPSAIEQFLVARIQRIAPALSLAVRLKSTELCHDQQISEAYDHDPLIHWRITVSTFFIILNSGEWAIAHASELKVPLLLLHSTDDPITSFAASRQFHENANKFSTFLVFNHLYHELHNEPEKNSIVNGIIQWINQQLINSE